MSVYYYARTRERLQVRARVEWGEEASVFRPVRTDSRRGGGVYTASRTVTYTRRALSSFARES